MFIALNKDKKRVHISSTLDNEKYYCPICGEELKTRRGNTNAHHFAHKNNSNCVDRDGWHYDMSDWHCDWQNQFPVDNQEIVFSNNNKVHRADVFINNTVFEFQHSPITESEFNERNNFYKSLGYRIIWIFDATDREIEYLCDSSEDERILSWKHPIRFLKKLNCHDQNLDVYLQTKEAIWCRQPDYKNIKDFKKLDIDNNIIKISNNRIDGLTEFISDDFYSDVEIIDNYCDLKLINKTKYPYKKIPNIHKLSDEIYNYKIDSCYNFYGYCPKVNSELYNHKECHACIYLDPNKMRCTYRFKDVIKEKISEIYEIEHDRDGRITSVELEINNQRKKYRLKPLPFYTKTLLEFAETFKNFRVARFINTDNNKIVQLSRYQMDQLIKTKKCYGKLCSEDYRKASNSEFEIFGWNKPIWLLIWYKDETDDYYESFNKTNNERSQIQNITIHVEPIKKSPSSNKNTIYNNVHVPTYCPKCGSLISLVEYNGNQIVGCSRYPNCDYIAME